MKKVYVAYTSVIACNYNENNMPTRMRLTVWARTHTQSYAVIAELNLPYMDCYRMYDKAKEIKRIAENVFALNGYEVE